MEVICEGAVRPSARLASPVPGPSIGDLVALELPDPKRELCAVLGVSSRTLSLLSSIQVRFLGDLLVLSRADVATIRGLGPKRLREVERALARRGLRLARGNNTVAPHALSGVEHEASILTLGLATKTAAKLHGAGIVTVGDLVRQRSCDLHRLPGLGVTMHEEIRHILAKHGLSLAVYIPPNLHPPPVKGDPTTTIESLGEHGFLSVRIENILCLNGARTVGDIATKSAAELFAIAGFGQTYLAKIRAALEWMGMALRGE